jgi:hypothetical protein
MADNFIYSGHYNSKPSWTGLINSVSCIVRWNGVDYWEIVNWPYEGTAKSYTTDDVPLTGWAVYGANTTIEVSIDLGPCPTATPTITPTLTITQSITPTITVTPTFTLTPTYTLTPTFTLTETLTPTLTVTPTITPTETLTPTLLLQLKLLHQHIPSRQLSQLHNQLHQPKLLHQHLR